MSSTRIIYRALLNARAVATWVVPDGMTSHVHEFVGRQPKHRHGQT